MTRPFRSSPVCACGKPARFLCDALVKPSRDVILLRIKRGERNAGSFVTCDAPLCDACRVPAGASFARVRGKGCVANSIDHCPKHALPGVARRIYGMGGYS